jgi:ABC-type branched-subunit amino acid transport system ATPase component
VPSGATDEALRCVGVTKSYGGVHAVSNVDLEIDGFGVHAVVGPNGAGKSTLFELISGGVEVDSGVVRFGGRDITNYPAWKRAQLGIARTFQTVKLVDGLSVLDNVAVASLGNQNRALARAIWSNELGESREKASIILDEFQIAFLARKEPSTLTLESRRMVELARAVAADPRILLLDEPASGLSVPQREKLGEILVDLGTRRTIVLVEHDLELVARIAQRVIVLVDGKVQFDGGADSFLKDEIVRQRLLGIIGEDVSAAASGR